MHVQSMTGSVKIFDNKWHPVVEISKVSPDTKSPDDRIFLKEPIAVPNTSFMRKSFKRSEIKKYKAN